MIKKYILGRLNTYYVTCDFVLGNSNQTYKEYKIKEIVQFLNLKPWAESIIRILFNIAVSCEVPFSVIMTTARFLYSILYWMFSRKNHVVNSNLLLGAGELKTKQIVSTSDYKIDDIIVITIPFINKSIYDDFKKVSIFTELSLSDILNSYINSIKTIFIINRKYGKRDVLIRSYSSFEFYLANYFICNVDMSNTFLFTSTYSRWGFLHGSMTHKTVFLQHGWLLDKTIYLKKIGTADVAYYINEQQRQTCEKILFNNKPKVHYLKGIQFNIKPDKKKINILLICEASHLERELQIIDHVAKNESLRLYVKPHPKDKNVRVFEEIKDEKGFILLQGYNFPAVEYAISYESTLAVEYEMKGVNVLLYNNSDFEEEYSKLIRKGVTE